MLYGGRLPQQKKSEKQQMKAPITKSPLLCLSHGETGVVAGGSESGMLSRDDRQASVANLTAWANRQGVHTTLC
jgi:hypothetical protein